MTDQPVPGPAMAPGTRKSLEGVRVLEFADLVAGPYCGKMFEDAIKAEALEGTLTVRDISELLLES